MSSQERWVFTLFVMTLPSFLLVHVRTHTHPLNSSLCFLSLSCKLSRKFILCVQHQEPVQAGVCPLLAVWDGKTEGGWEWWDTSCTWTGHLFFRRKATSAAHRKRQPHHLRLCNCLYHWLLGLTGMVQYDTECILVVWLHKILSLLFNQDFLFFPPIFCFWKLNMSTQWRSFPQNTWLLVLICKIKNK